MPQGVVFSCVGVQQEVLILFLDPVWLTEVFEWIWVGESVEFAVVDGEALPVGVVFVIRDRVICLLFCLVVGERVSVDKVGRRAWVSIIRRIIVVRRLRCQLDCCYADWGPRLLEGSRGATG